MREAPQGCVHRDLEVLMDTHHFLCRTSDDLLQVSQWLREQSHRLINQSQALRIRLVHEQDSNGG